MKPSITHNQTKYFIIAIALLFVTGCSSLKQTSVKRRARTAEADPVLVIYHVKSGAEAQLKRLLDEAWETYLKEGLVIPQPHICVQAHEDNEHDRFVEIFLWAGPMVTEYPSPSVQLLLERMQILCETRGGNLPIEFRGAKMILPVMK